jgi:four helix bundle protein
MVFLGHARGSNLEVQTQLFLTQKLGFGHAQKLRVVESLSTEVEKMLNSLIAKL